MPSLLGKRYVCAACGTETLCTRAGSGSVTCCGQELQVKQATKLPSSD